MDKHVNGCRETTMTRTHQFPKTAQLRLLEIIKITIEEPISFAVSSLLLLVECVSMQRKRVVMELESERKKKPRRSRRLLEA